MTIKCICSGPGYCEKFGKNMCLREYQLCSETCPPENPCDAETCEKVRLTWQKWKEGGAKSKIEKNQVSLSEDQIKDIIEANKNVNLFSRFLYSVAEEMKWRAGGGQPPTAEEKASRRKSCDDCSYRDVNNDSCTICGCYLEAGLLPPRPLGKLDCATQRCPIGMWEVVGSRAGGRMMSDKRGKTGGCGGCKGAPSIKKIEEKIE